MTKREAPFETVRRYYLRKGQLLIKSESCRFLEMYGLYYSYSEKKKKIVDKKIDLIGLAQSIASERRRYKKANKKRLEGIIRQLRLGG